MATDRKRWLEMQPYLPLARLDSGHLNPILQIQRDPNVYVPFARKRRDGEFEHLGSMQVREMQNMFPVIAEAVFENGYFGINGWHHPCPSSPSKVIPGIPVAIRNSKLLHRLNACYVDLDVGRDGFVGAQGMSAHMASIKAFAMMRMGLLPKASIMAMSGRGLYLIWLLRDDKEPKMPQRAWPEKLADYHAINQKLNVLLRELASDQKAMDAARVIRVPGSINTKSQKSVHYDTIRWGQDGSICLTYTLKELADEIGLRQLPSHSFIQAYSRPTQKPGSAPNRRNGYITVNQLRVNDLLKIEEYRGGFKKKGLHYADGSVSCGRLLVLTQYTLNLHGTGLPEAQTLREVTKMADRCTPPYPSDTNDTKLSKLVESIYKKRLSKWKTKTNDNLCEMLGLKANICEWLELETIVPSSVTEKRKEQKPKREDKIRQRREIIRYYMETYGITSTRKLAERCASHGIKISHTRVSNDIKEMKISKSTSPCITPPTDSAIQLDISHPTPKPSPEERKMEAEAQTRLLKKRQERLGNYRKHR
jgi:hypothetical protein